MIMITLIFQKKLDTTREELQTILKQWTDVEELLSPQLEVAFFTKRNTPQMQLCTYGLWMLKLTV